MRLRLRLPEIKPDAYELPEACPQADCEGEHFKAHQQQVAKRVQDPEHAQVRAKRYKCTRCGRSFRVYPSGVSRAQRSDRLKGIGVMLYVLGISYGGVEDALAALGWAGSKSSIYRDVQAAGEAVPWLRQMQGQRRVQVVGADATFVTCNKELVTIAVGVDALAGEVLEIALVDAESVEAMRPFINDLVKTFQVEVLLSDDKETYKVLSDEVDVEHGVCRAHVNRNMAELVAQLGEQALQRPDPIPEKLSVTVDDFIQDLEYVQWLILLRPLNGAVQLKALYQRYMHAPSPGKGEKATMWYRFRLALLRWWGNWARLPLDQRWRGSHGETLDGTNNAAERAIGWWVKERYRTMRTYKRKQSVLNVSNLLTYLGTQSGRADLAALLVA